MNLTSSGQYTLPKVNKTNPDKWYIFFDMAVPLELQKFTDDFPRKVKRFKIYRDINSKLGAEKEEFANEMCEVIKTALDIGAYNPFGDYLKTIRAAASEIRASKLSTLNKNEKKEKPDNISDALDLFLQSRRDSKVKTKTITTYENTIHWLKEGLTEISLSELVTLHVLKARDQAAMKRNWSESTINKEWAFAGVIFKWLRAQKYLSKNPLKKG